MWIRRKIAKLSNALKGWRTVVVNGVAAIVPLLSLTEFAAVLPDNWLPGYALGLAVANLWLRSATTTPVGEK